MNASDIMASDVITVGPESCVQDVASVLLANRISAVPVVDDKGKLIGIVSEGDLVRRVESGTERAPSWWLELLKPNEQLAADYVREHSRHVTDVMTRKVITVSPNAELAEIATLLERHSIKRVPVVEGGKLIGIISRANLLQGLAAMTKEKAKTVAADDVKLRKLILHKLKAEPWAPLHLNVTVVGGIVDVWGFAHSSAEKTATRVAVEAIPGVTAVNDNLSIMPSVAYGG